MSGAAWARLTPHALPQRTQSRALQVQHTGSLHSRAPMAAVLMDEEESARLLGSSASQPAPPSHHAGAVQPIAHMLYNSKRAQRTDAGWAYAYAIAVAFGVVGGIAVIQAGSSANRLATLDGPFLNHSLTCDATRWNGAWSALYGGHGAPPPPAHLSNATGDDSSFARALGEGSALWLPLTLLLGVPAALLFVHLFKQHPLFMVKASLYGTLGVLGALTAFFLLLLPPVGLFLMFFFALMALLCYLVRNELELCAELLGVSSRALADNFRLVPAVLAVKGVSLVVLSFFTVTTVVAFSVGYPSANPLVVRSNPVDATVTREVGVCYDQYGFQVSCCEWNMGGFALFYVIATYFVITWTVFLALQVKLHIVANLVAQWYYSPPGAVQPGGAGGPSLRQAVHHTLAYGFGTAAFASAILFIVTTLRRAIRNGARRNICCAIINCVAQPLLAMLEMYTKFASIAAAIRGSAFIPAAKEMLAAFKRCFLQTTSVWWVPDFVTGVTVTCLALAWSSVPFVLTGAATDQWGASFLIALMSFGFMLLILSFASGVLTDIVDTVYVLFAMDRDAHMVTREDVHRVFNRVVAKTSPDAVVEQPDGLLGYGRAEEGRVGGAPPPHGSAAASVALVAAPTHTAAVTAPYGYVPPQQAFGRPGEDKPSFV